MCSTRNNPFALLLCAAKREKAGGGGFSIAAPANIASLPYTHTHTRSENIKETRERETWCVCTDLCRACAFVGRRRRRSPSITYGPRQACTYSVVVTGTQESTSLSSLIAAPRCLECLYGLVHSGGGIFFVRLLHLFNPISCQQQIEGKVQGPPFGTSSLFSSSPFPLS